MVIMLLVIIGCNKMFQNKPKGFQSDQAKEYYYGVFKRSQQYLNGALQGERLPDWSKGRAYTIGNMEFVEFPLIQEKKKVSVPNNLSADDKIKVINASLSRIAFIKLQDGRVKVRLLQYVPTAEYLKRSNYDISHNYFKEIDDQFSGKIEVSNWERKPIKGYQFKNGSVEKTFIKRKALDANTPIEVALHSTGLNSTGCQVEVTTDYVVDCVYTYQGDVLISVECGEPEVVGITVSEGDCENTCISEDGPSEECLCNEMMLCDEDTENNEDDRECNIDPMEALDIVNNILSNSEEISVTGPGPEFTAVTDQSGNLTRPKNPTWEFYLARFPLNFWAKYTAIYNGQQIKTNNQWKWTSLAYNRWVKTEGRVPPCISMDFDINSEVEISADSLQASAQLGYTVTAKISCAMGYEYETRTGDLNTNFPAN